MAMHGAVSGSLRISFSPGRAGGRSQSAPRPPRQRARSIKSTASGAAGQFSIGMQSESDKYTTCKRSEMRPHVRSTRKYLPIRRNTGDIRSQSTRPPSNNARLMPRRHGRIFHMLTFWQRSSAGSAGKCSIAQSSTGGCLIRTVRQGLRPGSRRRHT